MDNLNIEFQEKYKQLDKLCKDLFGCNDGVSQYIREMEFIPYELSRQVVGWSERYKELKHIRWVRNQLAHEISINTEFCTNDDLYIVDYFYDSIMQQRDPLAQIYQIKKNQNNKKQCNQKIEVINYNQNIQEKYSSKENLSLWQKLKQKIKEIFSL